MQKFICRVGFVFMMLMLVLPVLVLANPVFNIVPDTLSIALSTAGTRTVNYTVTNDTSQNISKIGIEPSYLTTGNADGIFLDTDHCSDQTLAPNGSCTFRVLLDGDEQITNFILRPRVCGYDGLICSVPLASNEVQVTLDPSIPAVTSVNPSAASVSDTIPQIVLNFNVPMLPSTINSSTVNVTQNGFAINLISSCTASNNNQTFSCPFNTTPLTPNRTYTINVSTEATSASGAELPDVFTSTFTVAALIAGDGASFHNTYYVNAVNIVSQTATATNFVASTFTGGLPTGTIILLAGDGIGHMYFATTTGQVWRNANGGPFTLSTRTGTLTGNIVALGGDGSVADNMYYTTSTGQVWFNAAAATNFTQATLAGGTLSGTIKQIAADNQRYACLLTTTSQVWCGTGSTFTPITYSGGSLSGNIIQLVGLNDGGTPLNISFYTSNNQLWQQAAQLTNNFQLATYTSSQPTGNIQVMASNGTAEFYFATTTNQVFVNFGTSSYSMASVSGGGLNGLASAVFGNNGNTYLTNVNNQLFQNSGFTNFNPITVNFAGTISQFSGAGGYVYFVTTNMPNSQIWVNLNGGAFASVTHP
jgi:hypothetical protein